jgi:hypothetical protein
MIQLVSKSLPLLVLVTVVGLMFYRPADPILDMTVGRSVDLPTISIVSVDKRRETITLRNNSNGPIDLDGWYLISERGDQRCELYGMVSAHDETVVYTMEGGTVNCGYKGPILNNFEGDATALYRLGELVDKK